MRIHIPKQIRTHTRWANQWEVFSWKSTRIYISLTHFLDTLCWQACMVSLKRHCEERAYLETNVSGIRSGYFTTDCGFRICKPPYYFVKCVSIVRVAFQETAVGALQSTITWPVHGISSEVKKGSKKAVHSSNDTNKAPCSSFNWFYCAEQSVSGAIIPRDTSPGADLGFENGGARQVQRRNSKIYDNHNLLNYRLL